MHTEDTRQEIISFPFKMFKMRFLRSSNCTEMAQNLPEQPAELTQKLAAHSTTLMVFFCCY